MLSGLRQSEDSGDPVESSWWLPGEQKTNLRSAQPGQEVVQTLIDGRRARLEASLAKYGLAEVGLAEVDLLGAGPVQGGLVAAGGGKYGGNNTSQHNVGEDDNLGMMEPAEEKDDTKMSKRTGEVQGPEKEVFLRGQDIFLNKKGLARTAEGKEESVDSPVVGPGQDVHITMPSQEVLLAMHAGQRVLRDRLLGESTSGQDDRLIVNQGPDSLAIATELKLTSSASELRLTTPPPDGLEGREEEVNIRIPQLGTVWIPVHNSSRNSSVPPTGYFPHFPPVYRPLLPQSSRLAPGQPQLPRVSTEKESYFPADKLEDPSADILTALQGLPDTKGSNSSSRVTVTHNDGLTSLRNVVRKPITVINNLANQGLEALRKGRPRPGPAAVVTSRPWSPVRRVRVRTKPLSGRTRFTVTVRPFRGWIGPGPLAPGLRDAVRKPISLLNRWANSGIAALTKMPARPQRRPPVAARPPPPVYCVLSSSSHHRLAGLPLCVSKVGLARGSVGIQADLPPVWISLGLIVSVL